MNNNILKILIVIIIALVIATLGSELSMELWYPHLAPKPILDVKLKTSGNQDTLYINSKNCWISANDRNIQYSNYTEEVYKVFPENSFRTIINVSDVQFYKGLAYKEINPYLLKVDIEDNQTIDIRCFNTDHLIIPQPYFGNKSTSIKLLNSQIIIK